MTQQPAILVVDDQHSNLVALEAVFDGEPVDLVKLGGGALFSRELLVGSWMVAVLILLVLILFRLG